MSDLMKALKVLRHSFDLQVQALCTARPSEEENIKQIGYGITDAISLIQGTIYELGSATPSATAGAAQAGAAIPDVLFDSHSVYCALREDESKRTRPINVCDTLSAVVRLLKAASTPTSAEGAAEQATEREAFEAWASGRLSLHRHSYQNDEYESATTQTTWFAWQAAGARPALTDEQIVKLQALAESWDGCMYDTPGELIDIGRSIRDVLAGIGIEAAITGGAKP